MLAFYASLGVQPIGLIALVPSLQTLSSTWTLMLALVFFSFEETLRNGPIEIFSTHFSLPFRSSLNPLLQLSSLFSPSVFLFFCDDWLLRRTSRPFLEPVPRGGPVARWVGVFPSPFLPAGSKGLELVFLLQLRRPPFPDRPGD